MKEYLMGLFILALCCCVVELLSPSGEGGGIAAHIKLMSALCLLCALVSPLTRLMQSGETIPDRLRQWFDGWIQGDEDTRQDFTERWESESEQMDESLAEQIIAQMLRQQFSMSERTCRVEVCLNAERTMIREIRVALSGKSIWVNTHEVEEYIRATFGCTSTIYIE